jgi:ectoine hydroxylase-related dioxygenase (phytanoyl-CoA dioxygenase family)
MYADFSPITDLDNLTKTLDEFGVAVLPNVFSRDECDAFRAKVMKELKTELGVVTPNDVMDKLKATHGGMIKTHGVSLSNTVLELKTDERTIEPFRRVWPEDRDALVTSLDAMFIGPPPELTFNPQLFDPEKTSFHFDQASNKKEFCCLQSFINLEDTEHGGGCLGVMTGSHKLHAKFFENFGIDTQNRDWYLINKTTHHQWFLDNGCEWKMMCAPKGSMVLWDSRTLHMGTLPRADRPNPNKWRFLVYVCYGPARFQTNEDMELKRKAYNQNQCTAHWPYGGVRLFSKDKDDFKFRNADKDLTQRQRELIGIS